MICSCLTQHSAAKIKSHIITLNDASDIGVPVSSLVCSLDTVNMSESLLNSILKNPN